MTQEDKDLLLKDLCARLPYGVKCYVYDRIGTLCEYSNYGVGVDYENGEDTTCRVEYCKPYLFPLSSMTNKQKEEYNETLFIEQNHFIKCETKETIEFYLKNHFDYRGLIEKGLAIDATGKNIY